jgi:hypothetical protein
MPQPKNLASNMEGLEIHLSKNTFLYPPSRSNEKMNLVTRKEYKINETKFLKYFCKYLVENRIFLRLGLICLNGNKSNLSFIRAILYHKQINLVAANATTKKPCH